MRRLINANGLFHLSLITKADALNDVTLKSYLHTRDNVIIMVEGISCIVWPLDDRAGLPVGGLASSEAIVTTTVSWNYNALQVIFFLYRIYLN